MQFLMCLLLLSEILPHTGNFFLMQSPHLLCFFQLPQWGPPGWTETNRSSVGGLQALSMWGELVRMSCPHAVLAKVFSWLSLFSFKIDQKPYLCARLNSSLHTQNQRSHAFCQHPCIGGRLPCLLPIRAKPQTLRLLTGKWRGFYWTMYWERKVSRGYITDSFYVLLRGWILFFSQFNLYICRDASLQQKYVFS